MKKEENNFLGFIGLSFLAVLIAAFILTFLGVINLRIVNEVELHPIIEYMANFVMFMLNMFFVFSITLKIFDKRITRILFGFVPFYIIGTAFIDKDTAQIITIALPFIYTLAINAFYVKKKIGNIILRQGLFFIITAIYQQLSILIKVEYTGFGYHLTNSITYLLYSVDLILFYILMYCVVKKNVWLDCSRKLDFYIENKSISENAEQSSDDLNLAELNGRQRFIFWCMATAYQIFQLAVVLLIGVINNVFVELLIMLAVFWIGRPILKKSWHSDSLMWCSITTFSGFYILTKLTLPLSVSLFSCIALSALFVYILYHAGLHAELHEKLLEEKQERDNFTAKSRRGRAGLVLQSLSPNHIDYEILEAYVNGETLDIIADKHNLSLSTLNRKINALTRK